MVLLFCPEAGPVREGAEHQMEGAAETYDGGAVTALRFLTQV